MKNIKAMKVRLEMCATCPFRKGSKYSYLAADLGQSAVTEAARICHSTGSNAIMRTKKPEKLCRGSRNLQLAYFHGIGFISSATDAAWDQKRKEVGC